MEIVGFGALPPARHADAARILREALAHLPSAYNAPGEAEAEVALRCADLDWLGHAALEDERLVGWIGAIRRIATAVDPSPGRDTDRQRRGIGSALLPPRFPLPLRGVLTLFLGSDDDYGGTSLFGRDLWPDVVSHIAATEATTRGHALTFYRQHGYEIVGLLPDVNGAGRPDIMLAKRLSATSRSSA